MRYFKLCLLTVIVLLSVQLFAEEMSDYSFDLTDPAYEDLIADQYFMKFRNKLKKKKKKFQIEDTWTPFVVRNDLIEPSKSYFFQMNLGIGFLRFSGVNGGTSHPGQDTVETLRGSLNYSRTPLFEANLGSKITEWLSLALAYQHQGDIDVHSEWQPARLLTPSSQVVDEFKAHLRLDAIFAKVYFTLPSSLIWKTIAYSPYLAVGFGVAYQSWTDLQIQSQVSTAGSTNSTHIKNYKNKYSDNAFYMVDFGINIRSARPSLPFSTRMGCKYNAWGQARNLGKQDQQNSSRFLSHPIRIKNVYQFAPYIGVQWNY